MQANNNREFNHTGKQNDIPQPSYQVLAKTLQIVQFLSPCYIGVIAGSIYNSTAGIASLVSPSVFMLLAPQIVYKISETLGNIFLDKKELSSLNLTNAIDFFPKDLDLNFYNASNSIDSNKIKAALTSFIDSRAFVMLATSILTSNSGSILAGNAGNLFAAASCNATAVLLFSAFGGAWITQAIMQKKINRTLHNRIDDLEQSYLSLVEAVTKDHEDFNNRLGKLKSRYSRLRDKFESSEGDSSERKDASKSSEEKSRKENGKNKDKLADILDIKMPMLPSGKLLPGDFDENLDAGLPPLNDISAPAV